MTFKLLSTLFTISYLSVLFSYAETKDSNNTGNDVLSTSQNKEKEDEYLVGVQYFGGFYNGTEKYDSKDHPGESWLKEFPERKPINKAGIFTTAESVYNDIEDAASHGVDFFNILWYPESHSQTDKSEGLNRSLDWFMNSPNSDKLKFMLEITNHTPFNVKTVSGWEEIAQMCAECMKHPSYLKIDNRPVLKIHASYNFWDDLGRNDDIANMAIQRIREIIIESGHENPIIAIGIYSDIKINDSPYNKLDIDISMQYMDEGKYNAEYGSQLMPFSKLSDIAINDMDSRSDDCIPYVPFIAVGWDGRPWHYHLGDSPRPGYIMPTKEDWRKLLIRTKKELDRNTNLGFPKKDGNRQKAFTIYAWNEFGEGGFLAPTEGDGYMKLETVLEVFPNE